MVFQNPRYLINIGSDTPTIVVEGFRYNAIHLAAKVGNLNVARYVLHLICDSEALLAFYGLWFGFPFFKNSLVNFFKFVIPFESYCQRTENFVGPDAYLKDH